MSRHPNRPCQTSVSSYESVFFRDRPPQYQFICEGCGTIESGFETEVAAEIAGSNHVGVASVLALTDEEVDRYSAVRANQASALDSLTEFLG